MYFNTIATQFDQNNLQGFISALTEAVQNGPVSFHRGTQSAFAAGIETTNQAM